jgi:hypothetical protein
MTIGRNKSDLLSLSSPEAVGDDLILRHRESAGRSPTDMMGICYGSVTLSETPDQNRAFNPTEYAPVAESAFSRYWPPLHKSLIELLITRHRRKSAV